jgi:hypothetical protein
MEAFLLCYMNSSVSIATEYVLDNRRSFPGRRKKVFYSPQRPLWPTNSPNQWVSGALALVENRKYWWSYASAYSYIIMAWCLINEAQGELRLTAFF